jgi:transposase
VLFADFFALPGGLSLTDAFATGDLLLVAAVSTAATASCPACGQPSERVHSRYRRTVADLPSQDRQLVLRLTARKFFCRQPHCRQAIFCERWPDLVAEHARCSYRLTQLQRDLGLFLGGEAGARLAGRLALPTSPDTLLRRVKLSPGNTDVTPRCLGVDDWAWRQGQTYGTLLVDLERSQVLDLLPGRDGAAFKAWLLEHPGVEIITRDRWAAYAEAATAGAPQAKQVADRWHLLRNLREAVERVFGRLAASVREALQERPTTPDAAQVTPTPSPQPASVPQPVPAAAPAVAAAQPPSGSARAQARQVKRQQRQERYRQIRQLREQGLSLRQIAKRTGLSRGAVRRYCREERCPDWAPGRPGHSQLGDYAADIDRWLQAGGRNTAELFRQLHQRGCPVGYETVRRFVNRRLGSTGRPGPRNATVPVVPPAAPLPSARRLSFEFIRRPEERSARQQTRLDRLCADAALREALELAGELADRVRQRSQAPLSEWLTKAEGCGCPELQNLAASLRQDEAAVSAALTEPWSNGPVEGHINRLKLIKRQMYGRAGLELLRARVRETS